MKKGSALFLIMALLLLSPGNSLAQLSADDFIDIRGHWAEAEIKIAVNDGLLQGAGVNDQGQKLFLPDVQVNRAQLAVALKNTFALDYGQLRFIKAPSVSDYFWDVDDEEWYAEAAMLCAINEIFAAGRELHGEESVSRIEVARSIYRAFEAKGINVPMIMLMPYYSDTEGLSQEDTNAIVFVNNTGIMKGEKELFRPHDSLSKGELARIVNQCYSLVKADMPKEQAAFSLNIGVEEEKTVTEYLELNVSIPVVAGMKNAAAQENINNKFKQEVEALKIELNAQALEQKGTAAETDVPFRKYQLYTRCGPYYENSRMLSLYVDYYSYSGGAHGMTDRRDYNYDIDTGQVLELRDLFVPGYEYKKMIDAAISAEINKRPQDFFPVESGFQGIAAEQNYYLQNDTLVIFFNQNEIALYAAGIQEFRIPLQDFYKGLKTELKLPAR